MLLSCKLLSWKHRYLVPRHCLWQDTAALSRYSQLREEIETSCLILAVACFQVSSGKDTSDLLGLQPKEKQIWELSTRYQIFASSPIGRLTSPAAAWHWTMFDVLYTAAIGHHCAAGSMWRLRSLRLFVGGDGWQGRWGGRERAAEGRRKSHQQSLYYTFSLGVDCAGLVHS